jgi:hypothetical protein
MADHRDHDRPMRVNGHQVEDLVKALRDLERDLVAVLSDIKMPLRLRDLSTSEGFDDDTSGDSSSTSSGSSHSSSTSGSSSASSISGSSSGSSSAGGWSPGGLVSGQMGDRSPGQHERDCRPDSCRTQLIVNGALTIPCEKPDVEAVLRFMPNCRVTNWQSVQTADGRKIVVTGVVEIGVEYVANLPDQPMHFAHFVVPFHTFFLCDRAIKDVLCEVEFKHHELLSPRCISKVVLLGVRGV